MENKRGINDLSKLNRNSKKWWELFRFGLIETFLRSYHANLNTDINQMLISDVGDSKIRKVHLIDSKTLNNMEFLIRRLHESGKDKLAGETMQLFIMTYVSRYLKEFYQTWKPSQEHTVWEHFYSILGFCDPIKYYTQIEQGHEYYPSYHHKDKERYKYLLRMLKVHYELFPTFKPDPELQHKNSRITFFYGFLQTLHLLIESCMAVNISYEYLTLAFYVLEKVQNEKDLKTTVERQFNILVDHINQEI